MANIINKITGLFSTYSFVLFLMYIIFFMVCCLTSKKWLKFVLPFIVVSLSLLAYCFEPIRAYETNGDYTDLYRFWSDMKMFSSNGWDTPSNILLTDYSTIPVIKVVIFLIALTNNYNLLAFFSALITYGLVAFVLFDFSKDKQISGSNIALLFFIFICLSNYKVTITNIRMPIGMSLFFTGLYFDFFKESNRRKHKLVAFFLYLSTLLIHVSFSLFVVVRLLALFVKKRNSEKTLLFISALLLVSSFFIERITAILTTFSSFNYIGKLLYKIGFYVADDMASYNEMFATIVHASRVILLIALLWHVFKKIKKNQSFSKDGETQYLHFCILFCALTVGMFWSYYIFGRFSNFVVYLIIGISLLLIVRFPLPKKTGILDLKRITLIDAATTLVIFLSVLYFFGSYQYRVLCF